MSQIHLVVGPVGAGKSTYTRKLCNEHQAVRLTLDEWMATLFGEDQRPAERRIEWYLARTERCLSLIWQLTKQLIAVGSVVVLEPGLIRREARHRFYAQIDDLGCTHAVHVVEAERDVRRRRVIERNRERGETFSMEVPPEFFEFASDLWEPPDERETAEREFRHIKT